MNGKQTQQRTVEQNSNKQDSGLQTEVQYGGVDLTLDAKEQVSGTAPEKVIGRTAGETYMIEPDADDEVGVLVHIVDVWPGKTWDAASFTGGTAREQNDATDVCVEAYIRPLKGGKLPMMNQAGGYEITEDDEAQHVGKMVASLLLPDKRLAEQGLDPEEVNRHPDIPGAARWRVLDM